MSSLGALFQVCGVNLASSMPDCYTESVFSGMAISGIIARYKFSQFWNYFKGTLQIFSKNFQKTTPLPLESCRILLRFQRWYPFGYWTFLRTGNRLWSWKKPENPKANFCGKRALPADPCVHLGANTHSSFIRTHLICFFNFWTH